MGFIIKQINIAAAYWFK